MRELIPQEMRSRITFTGITITRKKTQMKLGATTLKVTVLLAVWIWLAMFLSGVLTGLKMINTKYLNTMILFALKLANTEACTVGRGGATT